VEVKESMYSMSLKESRLRWFGHVVRREETKAVRVVIKMNVKEKEDENEMVGYD